MSRPRATGAVDSRCSSCAAPVLTQWVGHTAALKAVVDLTPLTPEQQTAIREPNRLVWCRFQAGPHSPPRLRWATPPHPPDCGHPHLAEHRCTTEPTTLF